MSNYEYFITVIYVLFSLVIIIALFRRMYLPFKAWLQLKKQKSIDKKRIKMYCNDCATVYFQDQSFKTEINTFPCPSCAGSDTVLEKDKVEDNTKKILLCGSCNKTFSVHQSFKTEVGVYPCPYCAGDLTCILDNELNDTNNTLIQKNQVS